MTATCPDPIVSTHALSVAYHRQSALCDVSLQIARGRVTALIGPSGCGKTTFLNCLNRMTDLIPGCTVSGRIDFDGQNITNGTIDLVALRRAVGMIFQKPNPFPLSIRANLHLPLREHGIPRGNRDGIMQQVLEEVGLWEEVRDRLEKPALALSGGQQQRLCIARALALQPRLLLMDEPCSALDPIATDHIEQLIKRLRGQYTVVIVTHNLGQARRVADDVLMFWARDHCGSARCGQLIESGPAKCVFESPEDPDAAAYIRGLRG